MLTAILLQHMEIKTQRFPDLDPAASKISYVAIAIC